MIIIAPQKIMAFKNNFHAHNNISYYSLVITYYHIT